MSAREPIDSADTGARTPTLADLKSAQRRIAAIVRRTPVLSDERLNDELGARVFFKCENLQRGGAFKLRGATNAVLGLSDVDARRGVITQSSGNHGGALALAAQLRGIAACVVMPENASALKLANVRRLGAEVVLCKPGRIARDAMLAQLRSRNMNVVHPFDDDRVICGQGTATLEFLEQVPDLDLVMAPIGGGGLISGTAIAARGLGTRLRVIGAEPEQADDAYQSFHGGERVLLDAPDTIADGLRTSLSERTFRIIRSHVDDVVRVSEQAIMAASRLLLERLKILVEPSAAVPVAALLERRFIANEQRVGIILSGGNIDLAAHSWLTSGPSP